ncbi:MAG: VWA domain-containing protein, partial [Acidimicrobiia bacterium]|nr:VWA domain-containing protein [Acidimicrobiia bacterium]
IGGDQSYGMGNYGDSGLEDLLPVRSNPDDLVRRQPVAEVLVIDTSGSMGACHCNAGSAGEGGVNKTDISRAGAIQAIDVLEDRDFVGVVAVASGVDWLLPLAQKPSTEDAQKALGSMVAQGDTEIINGLRAALDQLSGVDNALRHIVLFTDGWDPNENGLLPITREIADAGITLSVLGTGEGPGSTLQRMAAIGGGRYYPGTDLASIPEIFVEETLTVARNLTEEGVFQPILASRSQITADLQASPALFGYVLTNPKGTASTPLLIGQDDPLLATWQRGLGRATAWTSDATSRWSAAWVDWEGYVGFWGAVVRDLLPPGLDTPPEIRLSDGRLVINYDAGDVPLDAAAVARVRLPNGDLSVVPLQRTGTSTFSGSTAAPAAGAYWVSVSVEGDAGVLASGSSGAVSSYQEEFAFRQPDPTLAADLASLTGGRSEPEAADVFDPAPAIGGAETELWPHLTALALALFLIDVALRRLVLQEGDIEAWKEAATPRSRRADRPVFDPDAGALRPAEPPPEADTVGRLLRRKNR